MSFINIINESFDKQNKNILAESKIKKISENATLVEGYTKSGYSWRRSTGDMIHIYSDGKLICKFPDKASAIEAGYDLDSIKENTPITKIKQIKNNEIKSKKKQ